MNPTPERALELANILTGPRVAERSEEDEAAAILRAYADLYRKWQAVLDAEPAAWFKRGPYDDSALLIPASYYDPNDDDCWSPLIIKPTA